MASKFAGKDRLNRSVNPRLAKHRSDYTVVAGNGIRLTGTKSRTNQGYQGGHHVGKTFDSYVEVMMEGTSTDLTTHEKKTRMIRVSNGHVYVMVVHNPRDPKETWNVEQVKLSVGMCFELEAGKAYRLLTDTGSPVEMIVTQDSKYDSRMEIIEKSDTAVIMGLDLVEDRGFDNSDELRDIPTRRGSKAAQQAKDIAVSRGREKAVVIPVSAEPTNINKSPEAYMKELLANSNDG